MLVLGYHGTLQPDPASHPSEASPPQMEDLLTPLLADARTQLDLQLTPVQRIFQGEPIPFELLLSSLNRRLKEILTLPLADHITSLVDQSGSTKQQLSHKFPALYPLLRQAVSDWVTAAVIFHQRLKRDSHHLAQWLGLKAMPSIESLSATTSDMHPGGHTVLRILFRNGLCIYYKPRPVTGEWLWHSLLESIAAIDPTLRLPAARVLPGSVPNHYGWMESVLLHPSAPPTQSSSTYWRNAGAMLCLATHTSLTDLHIGNIISTPDGPVVTDAECLATPSLNNYKSTGLSEHHNEFDTALQPLLATGLLPCQSIQGLPDVSGLFGTAASIPSLRLPYWSRCSKERYHLTTVSAALMDHGNTPANVSPLAVLPDLADGYRQAARALLHANNALFAPRSPWMRLLERAHAPRIVLRETLTYAMLLSRSLEPHLLHSLQRRRFAISQALQQTAAPNLPASVQRAELHSLQHLYIPRTVVLPGTQTLANASGKPLVRGYTCRSPAKEVMTRIQNLTAEKVETTHIPALLYSLIQQQRYK